MYFKRINFKQYKIITRLYRIFHPCFIFRIRRMYFTERRKQHKRQTMAVAGDRRYVRLSGMFTLSACCSARHMQAGMKYLPFKIQ
jgi:hypothetical protein